MKKYLSLFIAFFFVASFCSAEEIKTFFADVSEENPYREAVEFFHEEGVFQGNADGFFLPQANLSRAEFAAIISRILLGEPDVNIFHNCFPDVTDEWFAPYACFLSSKSIMQGFSGGEQVGIFGPHEQISVGEVLVTLSRLAKWNLPEGDSWYGPAMEYAKQKEILLEKTFDEKINRDLMAETLFRTIVLQDDFFLSDEGYSDEHGKTFLEKHGSGGGSESLTEYFSAILPIEDEPKEELIGATIEITSVSKEGDIANGLDTIFVQFQIFDTEGMLLSDRDVSASFMRSSATLALEEDKDATSFAVYQLAQGQYMVEARTTVAGDHILYILDEESGAFASQALTFVPGQPQELILLESFGPGGEKPLYKKEYHFSLVDEYGNEVEANLSGESEWGNIQIDAMSAEFIADGYGLAEVDFTATALEKTFSYSDSFDVLPMGIEHIPAYPVSDDTFALPIHLFVPEGSAGMYFSFDFEFSEDFLFDEVTLYEDVFRGDVVVTPNKKIGISGEIVLEEDGVFERAIGQIIFHNMPKGKHEITGGIVINIEDPVLGERLFRGKSGSLSASENSIFTPESRLLVSIAGKTKKTICIETFIAPNADVSRAQALSDIQQAEDIFHKNAQSCNCPHYLQIDHRYYKFSDTQWEKIFGEGQGSEYASVSPDAVGDFYEGNAKTIVPLRACTKVFYVHDSGGAHAGESVRPRSFYDENTPKYLVGPYIVLESRRDTDGRTLAHELTHHLSGNRVTDPDQARGPRQGATQIGNLMNYDEMNSDGTMKTKKSGDNLTKNQCELISWDHSRFSVYPVQ